MNFVFYKIIIYTIYYIIIYSQWRVKVKERNIREYHNSVGGIVLEQGSSVDFLWCIHERKTPFYVKLTLHEINENLKENLNSC